MRLYLLLFAIWSFVCHITIHAQPTVVFTSVITGLTNPMQITHSGDNSNRLFVVQKGGMIKVYNKAYTLIDTLLTITGIPTTNEQGLLSMAFHPNFKTNGYFYVMYTATTNATTVDRYTISTTDPDKANPATKLNILSIPHTYTNHNGGELHFGMDGYLYISTGDGGSFGDPEENSQDAAKLLGKLLRIDVNGTSGSTNYVIPPGNPYSNPVYCLGLRNPFRWSFDRMNGDLYIGDVGQNMKEEIDYLPSNQILGANFGWDCFEADLSYEPAGCLPYASYVAPVHFYNITSTAKSIVGGMVYRGYKYPDLKGYYFAIDYFNSTLKKFNVNGTPNWTPSTQTAFSSISDFGESEDGELYICNLGSGVVYQLAHATSKVVYTFTGSGDWMTPSNWKDGVVPPNPLPSNNVIVIKPYAGGVCNLAVNRTISLGGDLFVESGKNLIVNTGVVLQVD